MAKQAQITTFEITSMQTEGESIGSALRYSPVASLTKEINVNATAQILS